MGKDFLTKSERRDRRITAAIGYGILFTWLTGLVLAWALIFRLVLYGIT